MGTHRTENLWIMLTQNTGETDQASSTTEEGYISDQGLNCQRRIDHLHLAWLI